MKALFQMIVGPGKITIYPFALLLCLTLWPKEPAQACWNTVLIECFDNNINTWPWTEPIGSGRHWSCTPPRVQGGVDTWGIQEIVYSTQYQFYCSNDIQSAWCIGGPATHDPDFDMYQANLNTFMTYGPINLETAIDARVSFSLYMHNNDDTGDSLFWGADSVPTLALTHVWYDSSYRNNTPENSWISITVDLKDLHRLNGDSVSAIGLGRDSVYIYWWFKANSNATRGRGAFVDDVIAQWDDGGIDLAANSATVHFAEDTSQIFQYVTLGDMLISKVIWTGCDGATEMYSPYHVTVDLNSTILVDTVIQNVRADSTFTLFTPPWEVTQVGENTVTLTVDAMNDLAETSEINNEQFSTYTAVPPNIPPIFTWLNPTSEDTLVVTTSAMLRWEAFDPDDEATISIFYDQGGFTCFGPNVPNGDGLTEMDGPDSLLWNLQAFPNNSTYWPFAQIYDDDFDTCVYAAFPVHIDRSVNAADPAPVPAEFFLSQNYPNPFNPTTEISFGIHTPGHVSLRVYDLLGRTAAVLVNGELTAGTHSAVFDGQALSSGVYLYTLSSPEGTISRKMVLMK